MRPNTNLPAMLQSMLRLSKTDSQTNQRLPGCGDRFGFDHGAGNRRDLTRPQGTRSRCGEIIAVFFQSVPEFLSELDSIHSPIRSLTQLTNCLPERTDFHPQFNTDSR
jgi:hypothetical protein